LYTLFELAIAIAFGIFTLGSAFLIYFSKSLLHSSILLALSFIGGSMLILLESQSILALLQLLIFVGGLSTYFIITISDEKIKSTKKNLLFFSILSIIISASLLIIFSLAKINESGILENGFVQSFISLESTYYYFLYAVAFAPFAGAIGSILIIRRFMKKGL